jgi:hypothetical protein
LDRARARASSDLPKAGVPLKSAAAILLFYPNADAFPCDTSIDKGTHRGAALLQKRIDRSEDELA